MPAADAISVSITAVMIFREFRRPSAFTHQSSGERRALD
jgi:hypothetical protein